MKDKDLLYYIENGASLDKDLQPIKNKNGYMVSIIGMEKTFLPSAIDEIKKTIYEYRDKLKSCQFVGIWKYKGLVYIDISRHYNKKQDAINSGIVNKQLSIHSLKNDDDIFLTIPTYILYRYNKIKNDIYYIKEYDTKKDMEKDLKMDYHTLTSYIMNSIDAPIKHLLNDKYIIIKEDVLINEKEG